MPTKKNIVQPRVAPKPRPAGNDIPVPVATPRKRDNLDAMFPTSKVTGVPVVERKARMRSRHWEKEHGYGNQYSIYGVRSDVKKWVDDIAARLDVRTGEVAEFALDYSVRLLKSDKLKIVTYLNPRGRRHTLYPVKDSEDKKKTRREKKLIVTWWPFDQDLKKYIGEASDFNNVSQGELVTFLLEKAREDHGSGLLTFKFEKGSSDQDTFKLPE